MDSNARRSELARHGYEVVEIERVGLIEASESRWFYRGQFCGASILRCAFSDRNRAWSFLDSYERRKTLSLLRKVAR